MGAELKPCPFCGATPAPRHEKRDGADWWWVDCTKARSEDCPAFCYTGAATKREAIERWNRRTPDMTAALARLKALGEAIGRYGRYPGIEPCDDWSKEIAAIRKVLGANDAEPKPEP